MPSTSARGCADSTHAASERRSTSNPRPIVDRHEPDELSRERPAPPPHHPLIALGVVECGGAILSAFSLSLAAVTFQSFGEIRPVIRAAARVFSDLEAARTMPIGPSSLLKPGRPRSGPRETR
jgi:hypothetical protein